MSVHQHLKLIKKIMKLNDNSAMTTFITTEKVFSEIAQDTAYKSIDIIVEI